MPLFEVDGSHTLQLQYLVGISVPGLTLLKHHTMRAAAQAYRPGWQTHAYGIGARNPFRSPTHVFLREPELRRMNDNNQSDDVIHLDCALQGAYSKARCTRQRQSALGSHAILARGFATQES